MRQLVAWVLGLTPVLAPAAGDWPGLPPDCWSESRLVHTGHAGELWEKNTRITQVAGTLAKGGEASPNRGYAFVRHGDWPQASIVINAEKESLTRIEFSGLSALDRVAWINEKLLSIRVWWGRAAGNDLIFDVEGGAFIYVEEFRDGSIARRQFVERCPQTGCTCIGADKGR